MRMTERRLREVIRGVIVEAYPMARRIGRLRVFEYEDIAELIDFGTVEFEKEGFGDEDFRLSLSVRNPKIGGEVKEVEALNYFDFGFEAIEKDWGGDVRRAFCEVYVSVIFRKIVRMIVAGSRTPVSERENEGVIRELCDRIVDVLLEKSGHDDLEAFLVSRGVSLY
jgi:hypothetical protein